MIDGLRPYSEMKPSGLPWLGDVPAHWDVRRNGRLFGSRRETGFPDLPVLEVSLRSGVRVRDFDNGTRKQEIGDRSKYQRAVRGDIAYNMMRMWQGAVGVAPVDGLVSPAYVVARPFAETDAAYYAYVFRTAAYMREVDTFSRGIVPDRNRLYWESFKQMPSVYPPLDEQRLIVRFLDWHGAQTAKLIRAKKKIIALLNEQKQAIIHRAVTRGLDPNVRLKPSGIPWLGDVPEGWEVTRLARLVRNSNAGEVIDKGWWGRGEETLYTCARKQLASDYSAFPEWKRTTGLDLLLTRNGTPYVHRPIANAIYSNVVQRINLLEGKNRHYTALALEVATRHMKGYGVSIESLNYNMWKVLFVLVPTSDEQEQIVSFINAETAIYDVGIEAIEKEIALIHEFRTRLIADVVTGKLDVRAAAVRLPETVEPDPIDDLAEDQDLDEAVDDTENEEVAA